MDIFKLIYEHDMRLDTLRERRPDRDQPDTQSSLEAFLRPDPTYSRFYITGTRLDRERFGLDTLEHYSRVVDALQQGLEGYTFYTEEPGTLSTLRDVLDQVPVWSAVVLSREEQPDPELIRELSIDSESNVGHRKEPLRTALLEKHLVLYKERAHHGFDLHLFSKENIYRDLFFPLKTLTSTPSFRFFSINGRRIRSEKKFYFETWTLDRPPHGAEEVHPQTVL